MLASGSLDQRVVYPTFYPALREVSLHYLGLDPLASTGRLAKKVRLTWPAQVGVSGNMNNQG